MISNRIITINSQKSVGQFGYQYGAGAFFLFNPKNDTIGELVHCRVEFAWKFNKNKTHIGFYAPNLDLAKIDRFFTKREDKLKLQTRTIFYKVFGQKDAVIIEISPFWTENSTRRSLFTLLLRAALNYNNNFYDCLDEYTLTRPETIKKAIRWFFEGNVNPTYSKFTRKDTEGYTGFYAQYLKSDDEYLRKMLVSNK